MNTMQESQIQYLCQSCKGAIRFLETHVAVQFLFLGKERPEEVRRFCRECCMNPNCAVAFVDLIVQPLAEVRIRKVWG